MTIARETSMAIHSRADRWGSRVPEDGGGHIRERGVTVSIQSLTILSALFAFYHVNRRLIQTFNFSAKEFEIKKILHKTHKKVLLI